jgi:hypothetical protein
VPPGALSDRGDMAEWIADGVHQLLCEGTDVHLMMRRAGLDDDGLHDLQVFSLLDDEV